MKHVVVRTGAKKTIRIHTPLFPPIQNLWRMLFVHWILYPFIRLYRVIMDVDIRRRISSTTVAPPHCRVTNNILILSNRPWQNIIRHRSTGSFVLMDVKWLKLCGSICHGYSLHCKHRRIGGQGWYQPLIKVDVKFMVHSKLRNINLLNVTPSLISWNLRERMFSI